jgi:hypothetical protein
MSITRTGKKHSSITKERISQSHKGLRHSKATKEKISKLHVGKYSGKNNPMFGKTHSLETRNRMSERRKSFNDKNNKRWYITPCGIFTNQKTACFINKTYVRKLLYLCKNNLNGYSIKEI